MSPKGFSAILVLGFETRKENPVDMNDEASPRAEASSPLASIFFEIACEEGIDFGAFGSKCTSMGHSVVADATSAAPERFDARLCLDLPEGCKARDRRGEVLASEVGDLRFKYGRARDASGNAAVPGVLSDGDEEGACKLLELMRDYGIARGRQATRVVGCLRNNIGLTAVEGPSPGTMGSENQHLYGARMDSVPCAWSRPGASAMAGVVSRKHSHREMPRMTRSRSLTPRRAKQRERRVLAALDAGSAGKMVESVGSGCLPPHHASFVNMAAEVRYAAGIDSGMISMQG